jgi:hypothetical protein
MSGPGGRSGFVSRDVLVDGCDRRVRRNVWRHSGVLDRFSAELYQYVIPAYCGCTTARKTYLENLWAVLAGVNARDDVVEGNSYRVGLSLENLRAKTSSGYSKVTDSES